MEDETGLRRAKIDTATIITTIPTTTPILHLSTMLRTLRTSSSGAMLDLGLLILTIIIKARGITHLAILHMSWESRTLSATRTVESGDTSFLPRHYTPKHFIPFTFQPLSTIRHFLHHDDDSTIAREAELRGEQSRAEQEGRVTLMKGHAWRLATSQHAYDLQRH